ncbi:MULTISPECIES: hypothetical protein [Burkholderia]|uniref:hypothetical protein n=1 Tax=Burkholderia TaxID=32008 RepID=UPI001F612473|nr:MULTISPECIES: hypothetical protein [Burkholderia]MCI3968141.1 hypothetical protein [Burkholderia sp. HI4860]MDN7788355.1 hypothetical protein [Burkholderia contaminans]
MAVKRHANSEMFQVIRAFDDFAAVVGCIAHADHVEALFIFHQRSRKSRRSRLITRKFGADYGMNTIFPSLFVARKTTPFIYTVLSVIGEIRRYRPSVMTNLSRYDAFMLMLWFQHKSVALDWFAAVRLPQKRLLDLTTPAVSIA